MPKINPHTLILAPVAELRPGDRVVAGRSGLPTSLRTLAANVRDEFTLGTVHSVGMFGEVDTEAGRVAALKVKVSHKNAPRGVLPQTYIVPLRANVLRTGKGPSALAELVKDIAALGQRKRVPKSTPHIHGAPQGPIVRPFPSAA